MHDWYEERLCDKRFGVCFATRRTCRKCGKVQVARHDEGRTGGPFRDRPGATQPDLRRDVHRARIGTNKPLTLAQAEAREAMAIKEEDGNGDHV